MPYWDERFAGDREANTPRSRPPVPHRHPGRALRAHPDWFDVVVGSNLFGDILSDLGPAVHRDDRHRARRPTSTPSANFPRCSSRCTARRPDIAGKGIANPIGQIWSGAMMLEHLGHTGGRRGYRAGDRERARRGRAAPATWAARRRPRSWARRSPRPCDRPAARRSEAVLPVWPGPARRRFHSVAGQNVSAAGDCRSAAWAEKTMSTATEKRPFPASTRRREAISSAARVYGSQATP